MNCILTEVDPFVDPEVGSSGFKVSYKNQVPGYPEGNTRTEWIYANLKGDWKRKLVFDKKDEMFYPEFLDLMVHRDLEILRKMCILRLDSILAMSNPRDCVKLQQVVEIIDPTFVSPIINTACKWQCECAQKFCVDFLPYVINTCMNMNRMEKLYRRLTLIDKKNYNYAYDENN